MEGDRPIDIHIRWIEKLQQSLGMKLSVLCVGVCRAGIRERELLRNLLLSEKQENYNNTLKHLNILS